LVKISSSYSTLTSNLPGIFFPETKKEMANYNTEDANYAKQDKNKTVLVHETRRQITASH